MIFLEIATPQVEWLQLAPLLVAFIAASIGIVLEAFVPRRARFTAQVMLTATALLVTFCFVVRNWAAGDFGPIASESLMLDGPTYVIWSALLVFSILAVLLFAERRLTAGASAFVSSAATVPGSPLERDADAENLEHTEVFPLLLFTVTGMMLFPASNNLIMMFVALEVFSLPLYLMCGLARRRRLLSQEAAIKYLLLGALAGAFFLYGVALLYGFSGSFQLAAVDKAIVGNQQQLVLAVAGMVLITVGLLFKIGAVPFHMWMPDVYTGAPTPVTGFMAIATKMVVATALLRVLYVALGSLRWHWQPVIAVIAVITIATGAVLAITQTDVKRMLAYSAIAHAGFILVGVMGGSAISIGGILFYMAAYGFATLGAFAIVTMVRKAGGESNALATWAGLGRQHPVICGAMTLFLLSFAGIPLTAGFIGKWLVFASAWGGGYSWLVFVSVVLALVAAYFYLRVIVVMFFTEPSGETAEIVMPSAATWTVIAISAVATLVLGLVPGTLLDVVATVSMFLR